MPELICTPIVLEEDILIYENVLRMRTFLTDFTETVES